ncbi:MAG: type III glutamate--ammonia ligase [Flavobacteriales bacterium]|nr:type III glutamate--ammonia ligase [Flavobacteriales bacterium]
MKREEAKKYLEEHDIKFVLAQFVDIHGVAKTKSVPADHLDLILDDGAGFAGFALWGYGMGPEGPDLMQRGDLSTLTVIDWMPGYASITCDGYVNNKPCDFDSRVVLKNMMKKFKKETGMTFYSGLEPEFFLLQKDSQTGELAPILNNDKLEKPCYDYNGMEQISDFLSELVTDVKAAGLDVYQIDHEDGNGQYEINFTYDDGVRSADKYILFKMAASAIARKYGAIVSFMPKPFSDKTGNSMHMHLSVGNDKVKNAFQDDKDKNGLGLSKMGYQFLGGIMKHAQAITAIACPSVNSYKRLGILDVASGSTWAPAFVGYGDNNRTAFVRVPYGRLEFRAGDSSSNPYLTTAAIIAAGMDGIANNINPGKPNNVNFYTLTAKEREARGIGMLPATLSEAIDHLENDTVITKALGENIIGEFIKIKRQEWNEYHKHVSDWERDRYLEFY